MTLVASHLEDLRRSGLSDETIARAGIYSAPERQVRDVLGFGAGPGMVIPYPGANGPRTYARVRLDRPDAQGKRYRSPMKVQNRLYVPPMLDPKRLADVTSALFITEGEKKALKAVQEGLVCVGLSGVWSWRTRFPDKTRGVPLPELEALVLAGRVVYIVFDSDRLTNEDEKAERALATYLVGRGATVHRIPLSPGPDGAKVGWDDYLVTHSIETFCAIEPEPIIGVSLDRDRPEPAGPTVKMTTDDGAFTWSDGAALAFSRVTEGAREIQAEVTVTWQGRVIGDGSLNLLSPRTRDGLAKKLERKASEAPWEDYLDLACRQMVTRLREGAPVEESPGSTARRRPVAHRAPDRGARDDDPLRRRGHREVAHGTPLRDRRADGLRVAQWPPRRPHRAGRARAQLGDRQGVARSAARRPLPRARDYPAARHLSPADDRCPCGRGPPDPRRRRAAHVGLVIVDSLAPASGPEPETAGAVLPAMNFLARWPGTRLVLAHVSHASEAARDPRPYGSVFVWNLSRSCWFLQRSTEDRDALVLGLYHKKVNDGRLYDALSLRFAFAGDTITPGAATIAASPELLDRDTTPRRLRVFKSARRSIRQRPRPGPREKARRRAAHPQPQQTPVCPA